MLPVDVTYLATFFPLFVPQTRTHITLYFYQPMKRQLARVLRRQPISSAQSSPVYARDPSRSSLAFPSSCWTQAFISPPTLHVPLVSLPLPLSDRVLFCRPLALIHSIGDVILSTFTVKNGSILVIPFQLLFFLINGFGDKCCWRQPFSPTLKRCPGCLAWVRNGGHIHFPSLPSLLELGIGTRHSASVPRDTHLTVLYATR